MHSSNQENIASIWRLAADCYRTALKGWVRTHGFYHPNVPSTSCSFARCLHELGLKDNALKVLSSVVYSRRSRDVSSSYHPTSISGQMNQFDTDFGLRYHKSVAMCTRYMARYTLESRPNEEGRMMAIRLLKSGVKKLRSEIETKGGMRSIDQSCRDLLRTLEKERDNLARPLKEIIEGQSDCLKLGESNKTFVSI